jgi:hypothetical protein
MKSKILLLAACCLSVLLLSNSYAQHAEIANEKLFSIHCDETGLQCSAVGVKEDTHSDIQYPLGYVSTNAGMSWVRSQIEDPFHGRTTSGIWGNLSSVTCDKTGIKCMAVGEFMPEGLWLSLAYSSQNGGLTWEMMTTLLPEADTHSFADISCDTLGSHCVSIMRYVPNLATYNSKLMAIYTMDGGSSWSMSHPIPSTDKYGDYGEMQEDDIGQMHTHCDDVGQRCVMIGIHRGSRPFSYISIDGGKDWSLNAIQPALPINALNHEHASNQLADVACDKTGLRCTTIGQYETKNHDILPLAYTSLDGGSTWSLGEQLPLPELTDVYATYGALSSVACDDERTQCTAIGEYKILHRDGISFPLSYTSKDGGQHWKLSQEQPPLPKDARPRSEYPDYESETNHLHGVACSRTGLQCNAVGEYVKKSGEIAALSYSSMDGGHTWKLNSLKS